MDKTCGTCRWWKRLKKEWGACRSKEIDCFSHEKACPHHQPKEPTP